VSEASEAAGELNAKTGVPTVTVEVYGTVARTR